ncbi:polyprenyl synthetase family protein [Lacihabitans sp. CCS-44]|jgi:octaprenyl-diphosphate synthase|uniref:polyprenyl synthetase family protein n=1 Tax=Lacihabitans sp. CCS-44 TaxID=2487331 RepID=UPI0020CE780B|nr:polyprenyl synthetase family protein [Lacihabitans sp. CCS-44]MCP9757406.1 polyprenyl synthetase family protein [Lacihabitans sp. CCS-44]
MAISIDEIQAPIIEEMNSFEKKFRNSMKTNVMLLDQIMKYIIHRKGKQIRPMFVFLTAGTVGQIVDSTYRGAALIELVHTASLVHDDVVDDSNYRRGFFSINALWKNKIAVLVGDFLLSKGLDLSLKHKDYNLMEIVNNAVKEMSEGELLQIEKARKLDITEDIYFDVIRKKTASLIASCCAVGAASTGADETMVEKARLLGEKIGMAFQIKDDLFDFGTDEIGKPTGIDIKEKKMTLPLIFALNNTGWFTKRKIINLIKNESDKPNKVLEVIDFVRSSGGIDYTKKIMQNFVNQAYEILDSFPESAHKNSLKNLVQFTIERTK